MMKLRLLNDDGECIYLKLYKYEIDKKKVIENGYYFINQKLKLYTNKYNLTDFLKYSVYIRVDIIFEDDRMKTIMDPSITLKKDYILIEKLKEYSF